MRHQQTAISFNLALTLALLLNSTLAVAYDGSSYNSVRQTVFQNPYAELPQYKVEKSLFGKSGRGEDNHLLQAAKRTLTSEEDLLDFTHGQKLLQANGICFAGKWIVNADSPYSGQFSNPTRALVIARASVTLSGTEQADKRAFGLALKLFPTQDPGAKAPTLNAFVMHSMGGTRTQHVLDLAVDNEPPLGSLPSLSHLGAAYRLLRDLETADKLIGKSEPDVNYRPVTHWANDAARESVTAPRWLRLRAPTELPRVDKEDFRDELRIEHYPQQELIWLIDVAGDENGKKSNAEWLTIGKLVFTESITSPACDRRLHFAHPRLQ